MSTEDDFTAVAAGFRRPSPLTREALADMLVRCLSDLATGPLSDTPYKYAEVNDEGQLELSEALGDWPQAAIDVPQLAEAILSAFSLPEPAEVEWEYECFADKWRACFAPGCTNPRRKRVKGEAGPWVPVSPEEPKITDPVIAELLTRKHTDTPESEGKK